MLGAGSDPVAESTWTSSDRLENSSALDPLTDSVIDAEKSSLTFDDVRINCPLRG
jgi:hypothetical protein